MAEYKASDNAQGWLQEMTLGFINTQLLYTAVKLNIADHLLEEKLSIEQISNKCDANPSSLFRFLRALGSLGLIRQDYQDNYELTEKGQLLAKKTPNSLKNFILFNGDLAYKVWGELPQSVRTGEDGSISALGVPFFEFLQKNPDIYDTFNSAMQDIFDHESIPIANHYDFSQTKSIADLGGGNGSFLTTILEKNMHLVGCLFDLPDVTNSFNSNNELNSASNRIELCAGDFFKEIPSNYDVYTLRHIIHDWNDEDSIKILKNCRKAMHQNSKLLILENIIPGDNSPFYGKVMDMGMLLLGGKERTLIEYSNLAKKSGFNVSQVIHTDIEISIIELAPA